MGPPIYQMDMYQKAPPKVKRTNITQKSPNWFQQLENIKSLQKNPTKSKKIYQTESCQKAPPNVKHTGITQKSPNWSWQLENIKCLQKNQQNLQKLLEY